MPTNRQTLRRVFIRRGGPLADVASELHPLAASPSTRVVHRRQPVHRCRDALQARLQLQRHAQRVVAVLVQVAALHPQIRHLRGLPHVAQLAFPRPRVLLVPEPRPQTLPSLSAVVLSISCSTQPFIEL